MRRALRWLNLYGREAVRHKLKNRQKMHFWCFNAYAGQPQRQCPSHQSILLTQEPIHEIFTKKYWELAELENDLFFRRPFWIFFFKKKKKLLQFNEKTKGFHMRYHLFLHYECFFQNLVKDFIQTNMHTTVHTFDYVFFIILEANLKMAKTTGQIGIDGLLSTWGLQAFFANLV